MKTWITLSVAMLICVGMIGCQKHTATEQKSETTTTTPAGETKASTDVTVETTPNSETKTTTEKIETSPSK